MGGPDFFQTRMGQVFFEGTVPRIASALEKIGAELEAARLERDRERARLIREAGTTEGEIWWQGVYERVHALRDVDPNDERATAIADEIVKAIRESKTLIFAPTAYKVLAAVEPWLRARMVTPSNPRGAG